MYFYLNRPKQLLVITTKGVNFILSRPTLPPLQAYVDALCHGTGRQTEGGVGCCLYPRYPSVGGSGRAPSAPPAQHHRVPLEPREERFCVHTGSAAWLLLRGPTTFILYHAVSLCPFFSLLLLLTSPPLLSSSFVTCHHLSPRLPHPHLVSPPLQVNCISTEFTPRKHGGEKGVPLRIQVDTFAANEHGEYLEPVHSSSCQVKVFKVRLLV